MAAVTVCYEGPIVTRAEALRLGLVRYFTGKPCIHGHIAERFTSRWICVECNRLNAAAIWASRRDELNAARRTPEERVKKRQQRRDWFAANPGKMREYNLAKKARRQNQLGRFTADDEAKLRARQKRCHICGGRFTKADPATLDHVVALAAGGAHDVSNIALAHLSCNCRKQEFRTHLV